MGWLKKVWDFMGKLFSPSTANAIMLGIRAAAPYVQTALTLCSAAQALAPREAPGKTFGTVMRYADYLNIPFVFDGEVTELKVQTALRDLTVKALRAKFPEASAADLNRAVEIAVGAIKNF